MGYAFTLTLFCIFILLSVNIWGVVKIDPINLGAFNVHLVDFAFIGFASSAYFRMKSLKEVFHVYDRVIGKPFFIFLVWTLFLALYSITILGQNVNNTVRFLIGIWYMSIYFLLPAIASNKREYKNLVILLLIFLVGAYLVNLFQNITGWHPSTSFDQTEMSYTVDMGGIYRTWNPTQMWLIGLVAFTITRVYYDKVTLGRLIALFFMLIFLAFTFFRSYYLGFGVTLLFLIFTNVKKQGKKQHRTVGKLLLNVIQLGVLAYVLVIGVLALFPIIEERLISTFIEISEGSGTFGHRIRLLALSYVYMDNVLLGGGFATLEYSNKIGSSIDFLIASLSSGADSGIINLFFRFGLIGLILYVWMTILLFLKSFERLRSISINEHYIIIMASCAYTVWVWVGGIANNTFTSMANAPVLVTFWAMNDIVWNLYGREHTISHSATID